MGEPDPYQATIRYSREDSLADFTLVLGCSFGATLMMVHQIPMIEAEQVEDGGM